MTAFPLLLESQIPAVRRYARALARSPDQADDLVQDCLCRALQKQHLWEPGTNLRSWLFTILHNQHVNGIRSAIRRGTEVPDDGDDIEPLLVGAPRQDDRLLLRDLHRAFGVLSMEQREVVLLVGLEGLRYAEVAAILGVPVGTVRSRLSRAREALRRHMGASTRGESPLAAA